MAYSLSLLSDVGQSQIVINNIIGETETSFVNFELSLVVWVLFNYLNESTTFYFMIKHYK